MFNNSAMAYKDSDYTEVITITRWPKRYFWSWTHLGAEFMSAFVFPSAAIAWALASTFIDSKGNGGIMEDLSSKWLLLSWLLQNRKESSLIPT